MRLNRKMVVRLADEIKSADGKRVYPKGTIVEIEFEPDTTVRVSVPGQQPVYAGLYEIEGSTLRLGAQKFQPNIDELR